MPHILTLQSPVTKQQLKQIDPGTTCVQWDKELSNSEAKAIAAAVAPFPEIVLRIWGCNPGRWHSTLHHFADRKRFNLDSLDIKGFEPLRELSPHLEELTLGSTYPAKPSLKTLDHFPRLKRLSITNHRKDIECIAAQKHLRALYLRSITLPDLKLLLPMKNLRWLWLGLGGTRNLDLLPQIGKLRYLELWRILGLSDLTPISNIVTLEHLYLQNLPQVKALPSFAKLHQLRRITLDSMRGITSVVPLALAPSLTHLSVFAKPPLAARHFACLVGHPTLKHARIGLGSNRENLAVERQLPLPPFEGLDKMAWDRA